jgi:hypothetical protein
MKNITHNRFRNYEPQRQFSLRKHVLRVNAGLTPTCDAIRERKLPLVQGGQDRSDESTAASGWIFAACVACVILGTVLVWAGQVLFQMARG